MDSGLGFTASPAGDLLSAHCEQELQDLMLQIDHMVQEKKGEWERDLQIVESRLQNKSQECSALSGEINTLREECSVLRKAKRDLEAQRKKHSSEMENQMCELRAQVQNMARTQDRLGKKHAKKVHLLESELANAKNEIQKFQVEMAKKDSQCMVLQRHMESSSSARTAAEEKAAFSQQQVSAFQTQLEKRRALLEGTETTLKAQVAALQIELAQKKDQLASESANSQNVRKALSEQAEFLKTLQEERESQETTMRTARRTIGRLEDELARVSAECKVREQEAQRAENDLQGRLKELMSAQEKLREKGDKLAAAASQRASVDTNTSVELQEAKASMKVAIRGEKRALEELNSIKNMIAEKDKLIEELTAKLSKKTSDDRGGQEDEIARLVEQLTLTKMSLNTVRNDKEENERLSRAVSENSELRYDEAQAELVVQRERGNMAEKREASLKNELERRIAELSVANTQLDALRMENRHCREAVVKEEQRRKSAEDACRSTSPPIVSTAERSTITDEVVVPIHSAPNDNKENRVESSEVLHERERADAAENQIAQLRAENRALVEFVSSVTGTLADGVVNGVRDHMADNEESFGPLPMMQLSQHPVTSMSITQDLEDSTVQEFGVRFLAEEEARARQLEALINSHIDDVRQSQSPVNRNSSGLMQQTSLTSPITGL